MKQNIYNAQIIKLTGGQSKDDVSKIEAFFELLEEKCDLPLVSKSILREHFLEAFEYYLDNGKTVTEVCELLDPQKLGDFYLDDDRKYYSLDNAAIVYPLGMTFDQMPMFRLSVVLFDDVVPELLQIALDLTIRRFPLFLSVIKNGFFWHYLETNKIIPVVEQENDIPCKPISLILRSNRSFRLLYYKKRISLEVFHVLSDGSGALIFLKTLVSEYLRLSGHEIPCEKGVRDLDEPIVEQELANEFINAKGSGSLSTFTDKRALQLDGKLVHTNMSRIIHFNMNATSLRKKAKEYGGTVTTYLLALEFLAIRKAISANKGVVNVQIPVNMRKFDHSITMRNYSMYFNASCEINEIKDRKQLVDLFNEQFKERGNEEVMNTMMKTTDNLIRSLSFVPLIIKTPLMQVIYPYMANNIVTGVLSNLGVIEAPEQLKEYVDRFMFILNPSRPNRFMSTLATYNDKTVFTISKANREDTFESELLRLLEEDGLKVELEGSVDYES